MTDEHGQWSGSVGSPQPFRHHGVPGTREARKILPANYEADMRHIALATIDEVDSLVSWDCKHVVRLEKIRLFNEVNVQLGYKVLSILSPREVTMYEGS